MQTKEEKGAYDGKRKYQQSPKGKANAKKYYQENEEKILKWVKEWNEKNPDYHKAKCKEYNQSPKGKANAREYGKLPKVIAKAKAYNQKPERKAKQKEWQKEWKKKNPDYAKEYNQRLGVKERVREYQKFRRKNDKEWTIRARLRGSLRKALNIYSTTGKIMSSKKYGMDIKAIIEHLKPFPKDIENYHIDHIVPLSWFDFNNPKEIKWAVEPTNHQWLTKEENISKGNRFISVC